jgi:hypothetical protein
MTKDEVINELESKGIILMLGNEYHITETYKTLLKKGSEPEKVTSKKSPSLRMLARTNVDNFPSSTFYPEEVMEQTGTQRSIAFMEFCQIPIWGASNNGSKYRIRSVDKIASTIISNVVLNETEFIPNKVLEVIKSYYLNINMPKAFKTFMKDDFVEMYMEHLEGNTLEGDIESDKKPNGSWG